MSGTAALTLVASSCRRSNGLSVGTNKMMNLPSKDDVRELISEKAGPCVSIFMPTHRAGPETQQDPIRLKNLLREAEERVVALGMRRPEVRALLERETALLADTIFWRYQSDGLALFVSPGLRRVYRIPLSLPELVVVTRRFHLKPLLQLLAGDGRFHVLALSQNQVRLFAGTRHSVDELRGARRHDAG